MPELNEVVKGMIAASRLQDTERVVAIRALIPNIWSLSPSEISMCLCVCSVVMCGPNETLMKSNVALIWELMERVDHEPNNYQFQNL